MNSYPIILCAFLICLVLIGPTIKLAKKLRLVDDPKVNFHPGQLLKKPLPRAGGLPIFMAILLSLIIFIPFDKHLWGIFLAGGLVVLEGLLDDRYNPHPAFRLITQAVAALIVIGFGVGINEIANPFGGMIQLNQIDIPFRIFGEHHIFLLADLLALVWIIWTMNMVNWSSGVDGQMPGFIIIAASTIALLAAPFTAYDPSQWTVIAICGATIGACSAFLVFNWHPAKIHPGDSGSMFLGFLLAVLAIFSGGKIATSILVLGIPTLDAVYVIARRLCQKRNPIWGDRGHLHHKLLDLGFSQRQVALFYWIVAVVLGGIALLSSGREKVLALLFLAGLLAFILVLINRFSPQKPKTQSHD